MKHTLRTLLFASLAAPAFAYSAALNVDIYAVDSDGVGDKLGQIRVHETEHGTVFTPDLSGLEPGAHGFHVHEHPSCEPKDGKAAGAAGSHYDPKGHGNHAPPWSEGHLGDLPALYVSEDGKATQPVLAPKIKPEDLKGRALMLHEGGDNYSDLPKPLGGGGSRVACGEIK
ncbi:superoxide dismutase [Cu-Zn] SodC [Gilvimarinus algae]|uniref:Superoxide dismutase [Cu-Zn] n=1 Tax=Gilvimarinus algae TaxID=3058037 RepID=A0ABT8TGK9_9GAMM|nr:superoxide dismutase [Cu-Zn] SodC [Gilvimarinus sp. SDUM040014]MDO3381447.1 superoxide dismutase [Cu-Zn] SodC [Gilvimarinus sp. SDUM040014]